MKMPLSITIAWRNILRHKGKSLVIGVILFLGSLLMTVGNGIISGHGPRHRKKYRQWLHGRLPSLSRKNRNPTMCF